MKTSTTALDDMTQTAINRQMVVVFGANCRSSPTLCTEGMTFSAEVRSKTVEESDDEIKSSENNKKRKNLSYEDVDVDLTSMPSLSPENDLSEPEDRDGDEDENNATTIDCCDDFESKKKKRRNTNTNTNTEPSDLIVVLDMDECLIHFGMQEEQQENGWQSSACDDEEDEEDRENIDANGAATEHPTFMYVNENKVLLRPGLIAFLKFVTTRFKTHIFTAGTKDYADSILDQLCLLVGDPNAFSKRWYRDDCETIDILDPLTAFCIDSIYVKPLSTVAEWAGRDAQDLRRIVHIDDQERNFLLNYGNGIRVSEWRGDNPNDIALLEVTKVLQKIDANSVGDVRPHLRNESYSTLKDQLDMINLFPYRRTKGIGLTLL